MVFLGPAGTKTYVESPYAKQKREYEEVTKIQDPREKELTMGNRPDLFSPMSPDDMMMSAPPLAGSELAQTTRRRCWRNDSTRTTTTSYSYTS
jgi:hypothetical protein